jgi:hypothetical protein
MSATNKIAVFIDDANLPRIETSSVAFGRRPNRDNIA